MREPVFYDKSGKRWAKIVLTFLIFLFLMITVSLVYFLDKYEWELSHYIDFVAVHSIHIMKYVLMIYLTMAIILGFARLFILLFFSYRQYRVKKVQRDYEKSIREEINDFYPTVTVIVPVYNEEVVIKKTIDSLLNSNYPIREILVIDDGSTDTTAAIVEEEYSNEPKVTLIRKENGGKATALNLGMETAKGEIVVTIDADSILTNDAIAHLVAPFKDKKVAAVSGNCKVGNMRNQLTLWQHLEYVTANNLERRACEELNCITIVPGSNSAWRKSVVKETGLYELDTLAEDTDLTIKLLNNGRKIVYEERAISHEECPENLKSFMKQRFRWSYGILQSLWKHRKNIIKSENKILKYYTASMLFSYLLYLTAPLIDILFIISIINGNHIVYLFFLLFYLSDVVGPAYSLKVERESMKPIIWVFIQRLAYRYLIAYVTWKTFFIAVKGSPVGWEKLIRSGNNNH